MKKAKKLTLDERIESLGYLCDFFRNRLRDLSYDLVSNGSLSGMYYNKFYLALACSCFTNILNVSLPSSKWLIDDSFYLSPINCERNINLGRAAEDLDLEYYESIDEISHFVTDSTKRLCPYHTLLNVESQVGSIVFQAGAGIDNEDAYERYEANDLSEDECDAGYEALAEHMIDLLLEDSPKKFTNKKKLRKYMECVASCANPECRDYELGICVHYPELWGYFYNWEKKNNDSLSNEEKDEISQVKRIMDYVCPWLRFNYAGETTIGNNCLYSYTYGITDYDATDLYDAAYFFAVFANYADLKLYKLNEKYSFLPKKYKNGWKKIFPDMVKVEQDIFYAGSQFGKAV